MSSKKILAFSSSRAGNSGYLELALPLIQQFLGNNPLQIAFIPFASVGSYEEYGTKVKRALKDLPYDINIVFPENAKSIIESSDCIMVGGGNTFKLLHDLYQLKLIDLIRDKTDSGTPYIGWSAGSNILSPTLSTTNDMPIIEPKSFNALGLLPFQINPHYHNEIREGFNGETVDMRLEEFLKINPGIDVLAIPEGTALKMENNLLKFVGDKPGVHFSFQESDENITKEPLTEENNLNNLL